jgi:hypothetical protein
MMRSRLLRRALLCAGAAAVSHVAPSAARAAATAATTAVNSSNTTLSAAAPPAGFDDLARPREILVDVYFGGRKVGTAIAVSRPGFIHFQDARTVAALIPNVASPADLAGALSGDLPAHGDRVCGQSNKEGCGTLAGQSPGVIFDETRFRVDLSIPSAMLSVIPLAETRYLDVAGGSPSLTSSGALSISGSQHRSPTYNVQNRTILALGPARVRTDLSYASKQGLIVDNLVGELDRHDLRYSAGLFWAPGLDLTGRRRIVGLGMGTQFDTRADRDNLIGTPLILFLSQPARVDFLIDGRLVGSRSYDAGNNVVDTSALPDGSYPLVLKIHEANGTEREERRFFAKSTQVAPVGEPLYFAYAGMLANTRRDRLISLSDDFYYQFGAATRLSQAVAVDLSLVGTQRKAMVEAGTWLLTQFAQVRAAGLISTVGDKALLLQATSGGRGPFNFAFDLRRVWSRDGRPIIPVPSFVDSFSGSQPTGAQLGGTYTQASASIGLRLGNAYLSTLGTLRKDAGNRSNYSIGPSLTWPFLNIGRLQMTLQADAQKSRHSSSAFAGIRLVYSGKSGSVNADAGYASVDSRNGTGPSKSRAVGGLAANYYYEDDNRTQLSAGAGVQRSIDSTVAHAGATLYSQLGNVRADLLDNLKGRGGIQYGLTLQSALAVGGGEIGFGARDLDDSAIIVEVAGDAPASRFRVLVNGMQYGHVRGGGQLPIHLQPYRSYEVRIIPEDAAPVSLDSDSKKLTLYPGTARVLRWTANSYFTAFGQAFGPDGAPIANALVQAPHSVGETDDNGYFQIDAANGDLLTFTRNSARCEYRLNGSAPGKDVVPLGKVVCR